MKKLFPFVLMVLPLVLFGQDLIPIVKESSLWKVQKITIDTRNPVPPYPTDTSYVNTWISGDTLIGELTFKKVYSSEFLPGNDNPIYQGAILEEGPIVSWIPDGPDYLPIDTLYNFDLEVGDTVAFFEDTPSFYFYVKSIDSVKLENDILRKRISIYKDAIDTPEIDTTTRVYTWIEGLGELEYGLIYPFCFAFNPSCGDNLICYQEGESIVYESFPLACSITTSTNAHLGDSFVKLYPNPFSQRLNLELTKSKEVLILIHDTSGKLLLRRKENKGFYKDNFPLDLNELERGVYIITLITNEMTISKTIIKQ